MRILFAGTPEIAVPSLRETAKHFEIAGVLTSPDRRQGRGQKLCVSPVKQAAVELGVPVLQFPSLKREAREAVAELQPELLAVFAYGRIFGPKFLSLFPKGGVNVHPSLLPRYRGPSPIQAAILSGDAVSGVTVQKIALEMDTGDIILQRSSPVKDRETAEDLARRFSYEGAELLTEALSLAASGSQQLRVQDEMHASYCLTIKKEHGRIRWDNPAVWISRKVRAFYPWPRAFTVYEGKKLSVLEAEPREDESEEGEPGEVLKEVHGEGVAVKAGRGVLLIRRLQLEAKREMDWKSFLNGNPSFLGSKLGLC